MMKHTYVTPVLACTPVDMEDILTESYGEMLISAKGDWFSGEEPQE